MIPHGPRLSMRRRVTDRGDCPRVKTSRISDDTLRVTMLASYRVPYWRAFAVAVPLLLIGVIAAAIWVANWGSVVLLAIAIIGLERFTFRTMYRVDFDEGGIHGRTLIKSWNIPLKQVIDVVPGWRRSF